MQALWKWFNIFHLDLDVVDGKDPKRGATDRVHEIHWKRSSLIQEKNDFFVYWNLIFLENSIFGHEL